MKLGKFMNKMISSNNTKMRGAFLPEQWQFILKWFHKEKQRNYKTKIISNVSELVIDDVNPPV